MVYAGELYVNLELTSNISQGVQKAKTELNQLKPALNETSAGMEKVSTSTRSMVRPLMDAGQGIVALGASAYAAGTIMGESGENFKIAGTGIMMIGSTAMMAKPLFQAFSAVLSGEMSRSLTNLTTLLGSTRTELLLFGGAIGIIAAVSLLAYKVASDRASDATKYNTQMVKTATDAINDYNTASEKRIALEEKIAGVPKTEQDLRLKIEQDRVALSKATEALTPETMTPEEKRKRQLEFDTATFDLTQAQGYLKTKGLTKDERKAGTLAVEAAQIRIGEAQAALTPKPLTDKEKWERTLAFSAAGAALAADEQALKDLPGKTKKWKDDLTKEMDKQGMAGLQAISTPYTGKTGQMMTDIQPGVSPIISSIPVVGGLAVPGAGTGKNVGGVPSGTATPLGSVTIGPFYGKFSGESFELTNEQKATLAGMK